MHENLGLNSIVALFEAFDADNDTLQFTLNPPQPQFAVIKNNNFAKVVLSRHLDYEINSNYSFQVVVTDGSDRKGVANINVNVTNVDESQVSFTQSSYSFGISEAAALATTFGLLTVSDDDVNPNVQFTIDSNVFTIKKISAKSAVLSVNQKLDRENESSYEFDVFAEEGGVSARAKVTVNIGDVNDVAPEFRKDKSAYYTHTLSESFAEHAGEISIFSPFPYNLIYDPDLTYDPFFRFDRLVDGFTLSSTSGQILIGNIDRERQSFYTFYLIYSDGVFTTSQQINITILDENDEKPVFQDFPNKLTIHENQTLFSKVTQFSATDNDTASNAIIRFQMTCIAEEMEPFNLNSVTGVLTLNKRVDYETKKRYTFFVSAYNIDQTTGQLISETINQAREVTISVLDVNDNAPVFAQEYYNIQVLDSSKIGMEILQLIVTDIDGPNDFSFDIQDGNQVGYFVIDLQSGSLKVALDLKGALNSTLNVSVSNNEGLHKSFCRIDIVFVHSASNIFQKAQYMVFVNENAPPAVLLNLNISVEQSSGVSIGFANDNQSYVKKFRFDQTSGEVFTVVPLNYEDASEYNLVIVATDGQSTSRALVNVKVNNIDDEPPTLLSNLTGSFSVDDNAAVGSIVGIIEASDPDSNQLIFGISVNDPTTIPAGAFRKRRAVVSSLSPLPFTMTSSGSVGYVIVSSPLDSTVQSTYEVFITISDALQNAFAQPIARNITVNDVNNNAPKFNQTEYRFRVVENQPTGTLLGHVYAHDIDTDANLTFVIPGHNNTFRISDHGNVFLERPLDYEVEKRFQFVVLVKDLSTIPSLIDVTVVHVEVDPVFEYLPIFEGPSSYNIFENSHLGRVFTVVAKSNDECRDSCTMQYSLLNSRFLHPGSGGDLMWSLDDRYFVINPTTGHVNLLRKLETSEIARAQILVQAAWGSSGSGYSSNNSTIEINIIDINNHFPNFTASEFTAIIPENLDSGSYITTINATDKDMGLNGQIRYSIVQNEINAQRVPFVINQTTGVVSTSSIIDYEDVQKYDILVKASDMGTPSLVSFTSLRIFVIDQNDNLPVVYPSVYQISISENSPPGQAIITIQANDADSGTNGELVFRLDTVDRRFSIGEESGILRIDSSLQSNAETIIYLNVTVSDKGGRTAPSKALVVITVLQVGVSAPTFSKSVYTYEVYENMQGPLALSPPLLVSDSDSVNIQLKPVTADAFINLFTIDQDTRKVVISQPLDYERIKQYNFIVTASDDSEPPNTSSCQVVIIVLNIDDNRPYFVTPLQLAFNVSESTRVGQTLAIVAGNDEDQEISFPLIFNLHSGTDRFSIHNRTNNHAEIRLKSPLECSQLTEDLVISLTDAHGNKALANTTITINTIDANNHCPIFLAPFYQVALYENTKYFELFPVRATDNDCSNENSMIRYNLVQPTDHVIVNSVSGLVSIVKPFDYENTTQVEYTVTASDVSKPSCQAVTRLIFGIINLNDYAPLILSPNNFTVNENQPVGSIIFKVEVRDDDRHQDMLLYTMQPYLGSASYFTITSDGSIILLRSLDFELVKTFNIIVKVEDKFVLPVQQATQHILVSVQDLNDNKPIFTRKEYNFEIPEEFDEGQLVGCVSAVDADSGLNGDVTYSVFDSSYSNSFAIDRNGCLRTTNKTIDVDSIGRVDRAAVDVALFVSAQDGVSPALSSSTLVTVKVTNTNDNSPIFTVSSVHESVLESLTVGSYITKVQAVDIDRDTVQYMIISNPDPSKEEEANGTFIVNQLTGVITMNKELDFNKKRRFSFLVTASETFVKQSIFASGVGLNTPFNIPANRSSTVNVTIDIINVDNHQPRFTKQNYTFWLSEKTLVSNSVLFTVTAVDLDGGQMKYSLSENAQDQDSLTGMFNINATTGDVRLAKQLDYETVKFIVLTVVAVNQIDSENQFTGSANIFINVLDENDHAPVFTNVSKIVTVLENTTPGTVVQTVVATDDDTGLNAQINYKFASIVVRLRDGNTCPQCLSPFVIDSRDGEIVLVGQLDAERFDNFTFRIVAEDLGNPPLKSASNLEIVVKVLNTNEHCPVFKQAEYTRTVNENVTSGSFILKVEAQDMDISSFVSYTLVGSTYFSVNESTGNVYTTATLPDYRLHKEHILFVTATDQSIPPCSAFASVFVFVNNINNHPPSVNGNDSPRTFRILENTVIGTVLFRADATDADGDELSFRFLFSSNVFSSSNDTSLFPFTINSTTGEVTLSEELNYEVKTSYLLLVEVSDGKFKIAVEYTVFVTSVNDNEPKYGRIHYVFNILEEAPAGTFVGCVQGSDVEGGKLSYSVTYLYGSSVENVFHMNSTTGCIKTLAPLDREGSSRHFLRGYVYDTGKITLTDIATIEVVLDDINDNSPQFTNLPSEVFLAETTHVPSTVVLLQVTDKDYKENQRLSLIWTGDRAIFDVVDEQLVLKGKLDYERVSVERLFTCLYVE